VSCIKIGNAIGHLHTKELGPYTKKVRKIICNPFSVPSHAVLFEKVITNERTLSIGNCSRGIYNHPHLNSNLPSGQSGKKRVEKLSLPVAS
jgi:hypothetical protein